MIEIRIISNIISSILYEYHFLVNDAMGREKLLHALHGAIHYHRQLCLLTAVHR